VSAALLRPASFGQYSDLARRAAGYRAGVPEVFTLLDLRAAFESVNAFADDAWRRFGPRAGTSPPSEPS
jgi:hypothetical protein